MEEIKLITNAKAWMIQHGYYKPADAEIILSRICESKKTSADPAKPPFWRAFV